MFPCRARIPGDTPPSGYDDDSDHHYPDSWGDYYDNLGVAPEHDDGDDREDQDEPDEPLTCLLLRLSEI